MQERTKQGTLIGPLTLAGTDFSSGEGSIAGTAGQERPRCDLRWFARAPTLSNKVSLSIDREGEGEGEVKLLVLMIPLLRQAVDSFCCSASSKKTLLQSLAPLYTLCREQPLAAKAVSWYLSALEHARTEGGSEIAEPDRIYVCDKYSLITEPLAQLQVAE